jgi:ABC-type uncharacterized transport system involved in gliding motility auxiliary subunit
MLLMRALGWLFGLLGLLLVLVFGLGFAFIPDPPLFLKVVGAVGAAMIGVWLFLDWGALSNLGKDQTVMRSTTASFAALLALGIVVAGNVVAHRYDKRWDLTQDKRYTLSQQSIDLASKLDREVEVLAFFTAGSPEDTNFRDLMENYQQHSTLFKVEYHDPYGDPVLAQEKKILSANGTVILSVGENTQRLESAFDEEAFTNALLKVTSDVQHSVCLVTGHGELEGDDDQTAEGFGVSKIKLEGQNYKVSSISLLEQPPTPASCEVVVLASPRADLLPNERDRLAAYVAAGGGLIAMLDPLMVPDTAADFARYGVKVGNDVVVEADPNRQTEGGPTYVLLQDGSYDIHPITAKLKGGALLGLARSVAKGADVAGLNVQVIAHASDKSWAETSITEPPDSWKPDDGVDIVGDVPLVAAVEVTDPAALRTKTDGALPATATADTQGASTPAVQPIVAPELPKKAGGHVVVYGDADFAANRMITVGVNQDLFLNAVAWMTGDTDKISIRPNEAGKGKLTLDVVTLFLSAVLVLVAAPGLAIVGAVGTWLRRRRL